ncbi:MAG TPA: DUF983 domain-containing protein [Gemmatimonadaceae bacterium]|nr:DUF983 domain-containing protein [Gemmatimonadaceae bacterium]
MPSQPGSAGEADPRTRDTDTPLEMPSVERALLLLARALLLRCPHCGNGPVLTRAANVRERCSGCNLRFERGPKNYFSGAMFFGVMLGELTFVITFGIVLIQMWPNVPWKFMTYGFPIGTALMVPLLIPFSKVVWLAVDVMVRPVQPYELL